MGFGEAIPGLSEVNLPYCGRLALWLRHFDVDFYRTHEDLAHMGREQLFAHFIQRGWTEGRPYNRMLNSFIDPEFYCTHYPELGLESREEAIRHWMYEGYYDARIPNAVTRDVIGSTIHLYQMGKVGSKAIEAALEAAGHGKLTLHFHWPSDFLRSYPDCFLSYEEVMARNVDEPIQVISGVRDPFERIISGFYQSPVKDPSTEWAVDAAMQRIRGLVLSPFRRSLILEWFAHGFYRGLDVYAHAFDANVGFGVYEKGNLRLFLYRHDVLPRLTRELSEFVNLKLDLEPVNRTSDREGAESFHTIMRTARFPVSIVNDVLASKYVKHFFTKEQIAGMHKRWAE